MSGKLHFFVIWSGNIEMEKRKMFWGDQGQQGKIWRPIMPPGSCENVERITFWCLVKSNRLKISQDVSVGSLGAPESLNKNNKKTKPNKEKNRWTFRVSASSPSAKRTVSLPQTIDSHWGTALEASQALQAPSCAPWLSISWISFTIRHPCSALDTGRASTTMTLVRVSPL